MKVRIEDYVYKFTEIVSHWCWGHSRGDDEFNERSDREVRYAGSEDGKRF